MGRVARRVCVGVVLYALLALLCLASAYVHEPLPMLDPVLATVIPYTFFILGPPATLMAGPRALSVFVVETAVVATLVALSIKFYRAEEGFEAAIGTLIVVWIASGLSVLVFGM